MACVREGVQEANRFRPDTIIAIGGGSPMDAAKAIWLMYEQPETELQGLAMRFMDIRKRVFEIPSIKRTSNLVCIPTSSGTGSEVTPFAVLTDETTGQKHPLVDYAMTPELPSLTHS
ncbi:hypothetical protein CEUSTIGMA_g7756.t1 [Chlamydomonas eustigma]|uniref:Alcohol dehydrogenase iron-type/glycerol dehydrogenase GldA domain-containing protein n=1 Tax=Chlamydomonas eustigma TaxID=1157962 RepID=A0A250XB65_9CHLO|nr:hypothetical protein CEUSTIGMA_g7756.t1 [Chlamydomonas eustigma]|eukprot:GAX80318.1 hypothetical protein CEUSTIGMA_g7756.t1 [Chlamydomonas eustigma]